MIKKFGILFTLTMSLSAFAADQNAAEIAKDKVKANIAKYFNDNESYRCHELRGYGEDARNKINPVVARIRAFYEKAVAIHYQGGVVQSANENEYAELASEGRALEYQWRGKIGDQWFKNGLVENIFEGEFENRPQIVAFSCSQELLRAMSLVAPARLEMTANNEDYADSAYYEFEHHGVKEKYLKESATKYAAMAADWIGEADFDGILSVDSPRSFGIGGYFKDTWFFGVMRALRYKAANGDYGISAYTGKLTQAKLDYDLNKENVNFMESQKTAAIKYLDLGEELRAAGEEFLNASK